MIEKELKSINPKNNSLIAFMGVFPTIYDLNKIINNSAEAQLYWSELDLKFRLEQIRKFIFYP